METADDSSGCRLPSTKEILGEHLHHKIREILASHGFCFLPEEGSRHCIGAADHVTGMLLELSTKDIKHMLSDASFLLHNVARAVRSLSSRYWHSENGESHLACPVRLLSTEVVGEQLYQQIAQLEPDLSPQLTGMLLELDPVSLLELVAGQPGLLHAAVDRAKLALDTCTGQGEEPKIKGGQCKLVDQRAVEDVQGIEEAELLEELAASVYEVANRLYPECAAKLTGMVLEVGVASLQKLVKDTNQVESALRKAYSALNNIS